MLLAPGTELSGDKELRHYFAILKNWLGHLASTYQKMQDRGNAEL